MCCRQSSTTILCTVNTPLLELLYCVDVGQIPPVGSVACSSHVTSSEADTRLVFVSRPLTTCIR